MAPNYWKILFFLVVSAGVSAEPARAEGAMTWRACVGEAAAKNPDIAVAAEGVNSAQAQYRGAFSGFLPQLSASAGYTDSSTGVASTAGAGNAVVTTSGFNGGATSIGNYTYGLTATQSVFNGFQDLGKVRQGKANLEAARAGLLIAKATVSSNLKAAFAQLLYEQELVRLSQSILDRQQANLRLVTLHFEGGQENKGNLLYQAATVSQARYQREHAVRQKQVAIKQLAALLGRPDTDQLEVEGELSYQAPPDKLDFRALATRHPSHVQVVDQRDSADAGITVANQGWYPNLSLSGFIGRNGPSFPPDSQRWSVGATISFPFFPGTSQIYTSQNAYALYRQADDTATSTDNKLIAGLEQAYAALIDAIEQVQVADEFDRAAKARSVIATEKYNTGLMTFEDWSVIETDRISREQNLLQSKLNAMQAQASWELAEGVGDIP
jgi:outer membrane protein TolC